MRIFRLLSLAVICAVFFCTLFSFSAYAANVEQYFYNGHQLPQIPPLIVEGDNWNPFILMDDDGSYYLSYVKSSKKALDSGLVSGSDPYVYKLVNGEWQSFKTYTAYTPLWSSFDIYNSNGLLVLAASDVVITVVEVPDPPPEPITVGEFMSSAGQIFTSAVSWVSDVGAAIISQPLLLAFTALPLCGLGIAVFRRLKNTV